MTTLAERRVRGDLLEAFKAISGLAKYGSNMFLNVSRSGLNLVYNSRCSNLGITKVRNLQKSFLPERELSLFGTNSLQR